MYYCVMLVVVFFLIDSDPHKVAIAERRKPRPLMPEGQDVPNADHLRNMINKHIYNHSGGESRIARFLFHGDTATQTPLEAFNVLDRPAISQIARHAKALGGHSSEVDFEYWEKKVDFYSHFQHTGDLGEFDPLKPHVSSQTNKTFEKYKQRVVQDAESRPPAPARAPLPNNSGRRFGKLLSIDDGITFALEPHPHYQKIFTDLMLQAIYNARQEIHATKDIRSRFRFDASYRVSTLYAMCLFYEARIKALYSTAYNLLHSSPHFQAKFLHYLVIYEKALAAHTDIEACAMRINVEREWFRNWSKARMDGAGNVYSSNASLQYALHRERDYGVNYTGRYRTTTERDPYAGGGPPATDFDVKI